MDISPHGGSRRFLGEVGPGGSAALAQPGYGGRRTVTLLPVVRWHDMKNTRCALVGLVLATALLGSMSVQAVAVPNDETPLQTHLTMPLSNLLTENGTPADWRILGYRL
ncbi:hypothetical protein [Streptomyces noursei]|uniref:hypothetical protein n=1 Tax=Streptomyces noursei TaxID=1971 RepID=UPI003829F061